MTSINYLYCLSCSSVLALLVLFSSDLGAQSISGYIIDDSDEGIPYVNIYVHQIESGVTTDEQGYYFLRLAPGPYNFVISSLGFETKSVRVVVDKDEEINFQLVASDYELDEITIKASKKDPAFAIINKAIQAKDKFQRSIQSFRSRVYVKAVEEIEIKEDKQEENNRADTNKKEIDADPFKLAEDAKIREFSKLNLLETELLLNYQYPNKYKDEKLAYKVYGSKDGLYLPQFGEVNFDFYNNLVKMYEITTTPIVSPLSNRAILSYKYKLIESKNEGAQLVHKIKVIPRKKGNATVTGFIYINDSLWNINRIDVNLAKNSMKLFDELNLKINYEQIQDKVWFPKRQAFSYESKQGKKKNYMGLTVINYSDIELDYFFPANFFGNELSVLTQAAMDKDSSYWNKNRPEALAEKEKKLVVYKDSLEVVLNSDKYKDSIQSAFNRVDVMDLLINGPNFHFHRTKELLSLPSLLSILTYDIIGGIRSGAGCGYYKRFENERLYRTDFDFSVGNLNKDFLFNAFQWVRYDPMRRGDLVLSVRRGYYPINPYDAFLNFLKASNYFLHDRIVVRNAIELFNGFVLWTGIEWSDRQDISHLNTSSVFEEIIEAGEIKTFDPYKTFKTDLRISYTPQQRYVTEPKRKLILGSIWPTFSLAYEKGWEGPLKSAINYDYLEFTADQDIVIGTLGNSKYKLIAGSYLNTDKLTFIDIKNIRQGDPILYVDPLNNFQALDTGFVTSKPFIEFHYIHHFNGAVVNNIPLIKKTRISVVAGGGLLYAQENGIDHQEVFLGLERIFKIGARRRLRIGLYGVTGTYHATNKKGEYKISFDLIDTWKRDWDF